MKKLPLSPSPASGGGELAELRAEVEKLRKAVAEEVTKHRVVWESREGWRAKYEAAEARLAASPDTQGMVLREAISKVLHEAQHHHTGCPASWKRMPPALRDALEALAALTSTAEQEKSDG